MANPSDRMHSLERRPMTPATVDIGKAQPPFKFRLRQRLVDSVDCLGSEAVMRPCCGQVEALI